MYREREMCVYIHVHTHIIYTSVYIAISERVRGAVRCCAGPHTLVRLEATSELMSELRRDGLHHISALVGANGDCRRSACLRQAMASDLTCE